MEDEKRPTGLLLYEGFVLCEQARIERSGQFVFVGVFNDAIGFPSFPAAIPALTVAVKVRVLEAGKYPFTVELKDTEDQRLAMATGGFAVEGSNVMIWLPVALGGINFGRVGTYKALLTLGDNPPIRIDFEAIKAQVRPHVSQGPPERPN